MAKVERTIVGFARTGWDTDSFVSVVTSEPDNRSTGICDLILAAKGEILQEELAYGMKYANYPADETDDFNKPEVADYRDTTGRKFPRIYRAKFTVALEEVPDEEAKAMWDNYAVPYNKESE